MSLLPSLRAEFWSRLDGSREPYILALPPGDEQPRGIFICLHGHGSDLEQCLDTQRYHGSFGRLHTELGGRHLAMATLNYRGTTSWMSPAAEADISQLIDLLTAKLGTDTVYLMGGSMGGTSALAYAVTNPTRLHGVIAICPATDIADFYEWSQKQNAEISRQLAEAIRTSYGVLPEQDPALFATRSALKHAARLTMPVYLTHGTNDAMIPVSYSRDLYARLTMQGTPVEYVEIEGGGHDTPVEEIDWKAALDFVSKPE